MSLFQTLKPKPKSNNSSTCLLLDVSGSMATYIKTEEGLEPRRIDQMFQVVRETPECDGLKAFAFSNDCWPLEVIPSENDHFAVRSSTDLAQAFATVKAAGFFSVILVTDGEPDNEAQALQEAAGMKLGIIYIGNPPVPSFLERLAKATDGTFALADMRNDDQLKIALIHALPAPEASNAETEKVIKL